MYPSPGEPAHVMPEQQVRPAACPQVSPSEAHGAAQTLALPSKSGRHSVSGQSASVVQMRRQVSALELPAHIVPSQHFGLSGPQLVPSASNCSIRRWHNSRLRCRPTVRNSRCRSARFPCSSGGSPQARGSATLRRCPGSSRWGRSSWPACMPHRASCRASCRLRALRTRGRPCRSDPCSSRSRNRCPSSRAAGRRENSRDRRRSTRHSTGDPCSCRWGCRRARRAPRGSSSPRCSGRHPPYRSTTLPRTSCT